MDENAFSDMIEKLSRAVSELEYSVLQAYDSFLTKYGAGHKYINRIESYFPAIDKQKDCIEQLRVCLKQNDFRSVYDISNKICAISELIKSDAKSLLFSMGSSGVQECVNELVH